MVFSGFVVASTSVHDHQILTCQILNYASLTGAFVMQVLLMIVLVEKLRGMTVSLQRRRPRLQDKEYLSHVAMIFISTVPAAVWTFYGSGTAILQDKCYTRVSLAGVLPVLICTLVTSIYLTTRFCIPLVRPRNSQMQTWALRMACGCFLSNAVLTCNAIVLVTKPNRSTYSINLIAIAEIFLTGIAMHFLIVYRPEYKKIRRIHTDAPIINGGMPRNGHPDPFFRSQQAPSYRSRAAEDKDRSIRLGDTYRIHEADEDIERPCASRKIATAEEIAEYLSQWPTNTQERDVEAQCKKAATECVLIEEVSAFSADLSMPQFPKEIDIEVAIYNSVKERPDRPSRTTSSERVARRLSDLYQCISGGAVVVPDRYASAESARADLFACGDTPHATSRATSLSRNVGDTESLGSIQSPSNSDSGSQVSLGEPVAKSGKMWPPADL